MSCMSTMFLSASRYVQTWKTSKLFYNCLHIVHMAMTMFFADLSQDPDSNQSQMM